MTFVRKTKLKNKLIDALIAMFKTVCNQRGFITSNIGLHSFSTVLFEITTQIVI